MTDQFEEDRNAELIELTNRETECIIKEESLPRIIAKLKATAIIYYQGGYDDAIKWMQKVKENEQKKLLEKSS